MFTEREKQVLELLCLGLSNKEISEKLYISTHTTKAHIRAILRKMKVPNRTLAAYIAGKQNII